MSLTQPPYDQFPYGLASSADAYARWLRRMPAPPPLASKFMGMASYAPTCFFDLMDDDGESDNSSIGDMAPSHRPSRKCAMADPPGHPPTEVEFSWTHAPPGSHAGTPELTPEHGEELRQRWLHQPPTALARSAHHAAPRAHKSANSAWGRDRQPQCNVSVRRTNPPQFARASQNVAAAAILQRDLPEPNDPHGRAIHQNL